MVENETGSITLKTYDLIQPLCRKSRPAIVGQGFNENMLLMSIWGCEQCCLVKNLPKQGAGHTSEIHLITIRVPALMKPGIQVSD